MFNICKWIKNNIVVVLICVIGIFGYAGYGAYIWKSQQSKHVTIGSEIGASIGSSNSAYAVITYNGHKYQYNPNMTNILYAGIDSKGELKETAKFGDKPRADSIFLLAINKPEKKMTVISINRDTITDIRRFSINGNDLGTYKTHIGYAYSYGNGGTVSCSNLEEAVSTLLYNVPIDEYVITNQTSIPYLNRLVDGVTVTVPNDDLVELHSNMAKGKTIELNDDNVTDYLHYRDTNKDFSNVGRLERQQAYMTAFFDKLKLEIDNNNYTTLWNRFNDMKQYLQTSITKSKYNHLMNLIDIVNFSDDYYSIQGENTASIGDSYDEFHYDEITLKEKVLEVFYTQVQ